MIGTTFTPSLYHNIIPLTAFVNNGTTSVQLTPITTATGWSTSSSSLTLAPPAGICPALYLFSFQSPSSYTFTGTGVSLSYSAGGNQAYGVFFQQPSTAFMLALDWMTVGTPVSSNPMSLNVSNGTNTISVAVHAHHMYLLSEQPEIIPVDPTVSFNPPNG